MELSDTFKLMLNCIWLALDLYQALSERRSLVKEDPSPLLYKKLVKEIENLKHYISVFKADPQAFVHFASLGHFEKLIDQIAGLEPGQSIVITTTTKNG